MPRTVELYGWLLKRHIAPHLGNAELGKLNTQMIRAWRAKLLAEGVSLTMTAKAYRLLRAILMTAVNEDKVLPANPCRVKGAGGEHAPGRPVLTIAPPKSRAGLRTVSIPVTILPDIAAHLAEHTRPDANALVFTGVKGGPLRRSSFSKLSGWPHVVTGMGLPGLHVHDLRHTGNALAADMGVSLRNLMARMGHDNERAALIYQHKPSPADRQIADGLDALLRASRDQRTDDDGTTAILAR